MHSIMIVTTSNSSLTASMKNIGQELSGQGQGKNWPGMDGNEV